MTAWEQTPGALLRGGTARTRALATVPGRDDNRPHAEQYPDTSLLPGFVLFGAGAGLMNVPLTNAVMDATPAVRAGIASALLNASREVAGLLGITVIGAVLSTRQSAALRGGASRVDAFVDGYHTGLLVTIVLMAAGIVVSYLTLRPRPGVTAGPQAEITVPAEAEAIGELVVPEEFTHR